MDASTVRAAAAAASELSTLGSPVLDRSTVNYDILVTPITDGPNTGDYYVGFLHHHPPGEKNSRAGCVDLFSGISGGFIFNPDSGVTTRSCS